MAASRFCGVTLKRKVLSADTKLFEWRPCICTIVADHGTLLLLLQPHVRDESDGDQLEEEDGEAETMTIDLASQLIEIRPKKSKVRFELEYYASIHTTEARRDDSIKTEELMAPSAAVYSSRTELHILQRVEAALRELELENAQAKARERELNQEVQSLRDAARVASAERKHAEQECRHARREVDAWRRATQSAEAAAAQLQEQLGIAREESQLLAGEKLRLKRQNSELLTQVHRLDSLVYGRF
ncbi:hypothetical protein BBJ28_00010596 [Nothophytophthora sp. Chile5]|nr:hypothetical protein BBJ28_00010596 [Nothophytophthora sp. Chile5]